MASGFRTHDSILERSICEAGDGFFVAGNGNGRIRRWRCGCVPVPWLRRARCRRARETCPESSSGLSVATPAEIVTRMPGENALQSRSAMIDAQPVEHARGAVVGRVGQHQQEFLAAVAAEPVDAADVGEHGDGECPQHFVAGRMAVGVVDALEPVEVDQRDRAGRLAACGAGDLFVQHPHDAAAVERAGQFVEFGELLDAPVGFLELQPALVERLLHRAGEDAEEHAAPDGQDEHQHGGEALEVAAVRHRDRLVGQQKQPGQAERHHGPGHAVCRGVDAQRAEAEHDEQGAEKQHADFRRDIGEREQDHHVDGRSAARRDNDP